MKQVDDIIIPIQKFKQQKPIDEIIIVDDSE